MMHDWKFKEIREKKKKENESESKIWLFANEEMDNKRMPENEKKYKKENQKIDKSLQKKD